MSQRATDLKIFTVGWEPELIQTLLKPIQELTGIEFSHGIIGDCSRIQHLRELFPMMSFTALSKSSQESLPIPDRELLASLESVGIPTVSSMIQGDRVLRFRTENESLGYATMLAQNIKAAYESNQPYVILGSYDSLHAAIGLAVAKSMNIPWVAMAFTVIPDNLTGFCNALTPNSLVPITIPVNDDLKLEAKKLIENVRSKSQNTLAYRAPVSFLDWSKQYIFHAKNLVRRIFRRRILGIDHYTYPTVFERMRDITRRSYNRLRLPTGLMLTSPPNKRYVYYPLHMAPESVLDTWAPFYQDQIAFIRQLSLSIPSDVSFVVKLHFSDPDNYSHSVLKNLKLIPNLKIAHPNASGDEFIERASLVIGIHGTSSLQALLRGKPVLIFGDSPYVNFPGAQRAKIPDKIYQQIIRMIDSEDPSVEEIVEAYAYYMSRYMPGKINFFTLPLTTEDLVRYAECFNSLRDFILHSDYASKWYEHPPFIK